MERCVEPELLDELPPADPRAVRSRDDLLRVNAWMGNGEFMVQALRSTCNARAAWRLVDLGTGDGRFLLRTARQLHPYWQGTYAVLLDRRNAVSPETHKAFGALGWRTETREADVLDWLARPADTTYDVLIANLFLHHFRDAQLARLLRAAAGLARVFIAVEPRRWGPSLFFSRCLGLIACSRVTRHDAVVSVQAGFHERELSRLWPAGGYWTLQEHPAGWCSHLFVARRRE
jgi:SAM-dependent methyltransferase